MLVYGYGSYGANMDPWFSSEIFSLVDRGFVYAKAHIRGGSDSRARNACACAHHRRTRVDHCAGAKPKAQHGNGGKGEADAHGEPL